MSGALGLNLARALFDRRLPREGYGDMVDRCARCTWAEACGLWGAGEGRGAGAAPDICGNHEALGGILG